MSSPSIDDTVAKGAVRVVEEIVALIDAHDGQLSVAFVLDQRIDNDAQRVHSDRGYTVVHIDDEQTVVYASGQWLDTVPEYLRRYYDRLLDNAPRVAQAPFSWVYTVSPPDERYAHELLTRHCPRTWADVDRVERRRVFEHASL